MEPREDLTRRPLKSRQTKWAAGIARWLARVGLRPNQISVLSVVFAAAAGICFCFTGHAPRNWQWTGLLVLAAAGIQLRLLCNMLDGMVAVEGGFRTKSGEIYNEFPDRLSDAIILAGAGYAIPEFIWMRDLGWLAAVLALITAYVRALGASAGTTQQFVGPMAKPHRMAALTVACLLGALAPVSPALTRALPLGLGIIAAGCVVTIFRRLTRILHELEAK
jgi:phosphatidylglycerophosphate synthase